jgi:hypothetical protein
MVKGLETIIEKVILPKYPFILKYNIKEWSTPSYYGDTRFGLTFKIFIKMKFIPRQNLC